MDIKFDQSEEEEDSPDLIDPDLIKNENIQINLPTIQCLSCPETFNSEYLLNVHNMLHDSNQYCIICKKTVSKNFDVHVMGKHFNQCNLCLKTFTAVKAWKKHMELHTGNLTYISCDQCDKVFRQRGSLTVHIRTTHLGLKPFTCTKCEKNVSFTSSSGLNKHMRRFHNVNKTQDNNQTTKCRYCPEKLKNWDEIHSHESNHMISKFCKECNLTLDTTINFRKHFALVHPNPELSTCFECWMSFKRKHHFNDHIKNTHESIKYSCEICKVKITSKVNLTKHISRWHDINNPRVNAKNTCRYCSEKLKNWQEKKRHETMHKISKSCKECNLTFTKIINFRKHFALVHPRSDLLTCDKCWMFFKRKRYLQDHIKTRH